MGELEMRIEEAESLLRELSSGMGDFLVSSDTRAAVARITSSDSRGSRTAQVSTPGDRWFSVDIDGGFSTDHFEEETTPEDVRIILERCLRVALAYVSHGAEPAGTRWFPARVVRVGDERVVLRRSVLDNVRSILK